MGEKEFWAIIQSCRRVEGADYDALVETLATFTPDRILQFAHWFDTFTNRAYTVDLWGAAYTINGGCSDDGFYYFRNWLIEQGKEVYDKAVADPDSLADVVAGEDVAESGISSAARAAGERKGLDTDDFYRRHEAMGRTLDSELVGEDWDFEDEAEVRERLPRLAAMYLEENE